MIQWRLGLCIVCEWLLVKHILMLKCIPRHFELYLVVAFNQTVPHMVGKKFTHLLLSCFIAGYFR